MLKIILESKLSKEMATRQTSKKKKLYKGSRNNESIFTTSRAVKKISDNPNPLR